MDRSVFVTALEERARVAQVLLANFVINVHRATVAKIVRNAHVMQRALCQAANANHIVNVK